MRKTFKIITDENTASYKSLDYRTKRERHDVSSCTCSLYAMYLDFP